MAKPTSPFWVIVERIYVLINFSFEKERSADATVTGTVNKSRKSAVKLGNTQCKRRHTSSVKHQVVNKRRRG